MTQTIINEGQVGTFQAINILVKMRGWLACDNKLFDRTCPQCRGMYSSQEVSACPTCGGQLTYMTSANGQPIAISEGTFYPVLSQKQKERDLKSAMAAKGGVDRVYRFKMYSFPQNNTLPAPAAHGFCKKGAMIEIQMVNHQSCVSVFQAGDGSTKVQEMFHIYENYGDKVELLKEPQIQESTVSYPVNADGSPAPLTNANTNATGTTPEIAAMMQQVQALTEMVNKLTAAGLIPNTPPATNPVPNTVPNTQTMNAVTPPAGEVNPFDNAS